VHGENLLLSVSSATTFYPHKQLVSRGKISNLKWKHSEDSLPHIRIKEVHPLILDM